MVSVASRTIMLNGNVGWSDDILVMRRVSVFMADSAIAWHLLVYAIPWSNVTPCSLRSMVDLPCGGKIALSAANRLGNPDK